MIQLLTTSGNVSTAELAARFDVSEMTIRRDLKELQRSGAALPCYGGAVAAQRITFEFDFDQRHRLHLEQKQRIGRAAAALLEPGQTVFLDTGTTTVELARALAVGGIRCSVITASLVVASELWGRDHIELQLLGGRVRRGNPDLVGPFTEMMLERFTADIAFLGSEGIDPKRGSFASDLETARIGEKMAGGARQTVVVADGSKLGKTSAVRCITIDGIDKLITDENADAALVGHLRKQGIEVSQV